MEKNLFYLLDTYLKLSDKLRPGYTDTLAKKSDVSIQLPTSLKKVYSKISGTYYEIEDQKMMDFIPGYLLIRDTEYENFKKSLDKIVIDENDNFYPFLVNYSSDFYALKVRDNHEEGVYTIDHDMPDAIKIHNSIEDFFKTIISCYEENVYFLDEDGYLDMDFDKEQIVGQKYNPDIEYWFEE